VTKPASSRAPDNRVPIAPRWHTAALISLLLAVAVTGSLLQHSSAARGIAKPPSGSGGARIITRYLPLLSVNWGLLLYCVGWPRGQRARPLLPELLGEGFHSARRAAHDLSLALLLALLIFALQALLAPHSGMGRNAALTALLPSTVAERLTWALVALSVGFCEEVVYRGYLRTQLAAFTRSRALGLLLQAALFGIAHLEQGKAAAARAALYGLLLGILAEVRRSLWPGILCHAGLDLASGFWR
jgi:membrane protease YdiL (CAAX protease family)